MRINNFQELERQEMEQRPVPEKIKSGINAQVGFFQFVGNIFNLYIPQMINMFVNMSQNNTHSSGSDKSKFNGRSDSHYPNL